MQTVQDWQKTRSSSIQPPSNIAGLTPVSEWKKTIVPTADEPSLLQKGITAVKKYAKESADIVEPFFKSITYTPAGITPKMETLKKAPSVFIDPIKENYNKTKDAIVNISKNIKPNIIGVGPSPVSIDWSNPNNVADMAHIISGVAGMAFSPVSSLFTIAEKVPGLKQVADTINIPFELLGKGGAYATGQAIDWIPEDVMSKESKDIIKQPIQEVSSLAAQIVLGGKIMSKIGDLTKKGEKITPDKANQIVKDSIAESDLPNINIQEKQQLFDNSIKKKKEPILKSENQIGTPVESFDFNKYKEEKFTPDNTKQRTSVTSQKIEAEAIRQNLAKEFPELSKIDPMMMEEQTRLAREEILKNGKDAALEQIKSTETPELRKESIFKELKAQAIKEGDVETMRKLAKSNIGTQAAQALKALDDSQLYEADPVKAIKDVANSKIQEVEKKQKIKVEKVMKEEKSKFSGPKTWEDFIDTIIC